jgi:hypothetical protein
MNLSEITPLDFQLQSHQYMGEGGEWNLLYKAFYQILKSMKTAMKQMYLNCPDLSNRFLSHDNRVIKETSN